MIVMLHVRVMYSEKRKKEMYVLSLMTHTRTAAAMNMRVTKNTKI